MKRFSGLLLSAVIAILLVACGGDGAQTFSAALNGGNEVPAVTTDATGSAKLTLKGDAMSLTGTYEGLSGPASGAHIHGPAAKDATAGVLFTLAYTEGSTAGSGTLSGSGTLTAAQIQELKDGLYYVNIHTATNAGGEIRGQLE